MLQFRRDEIVNRGLRPRFVVDLGQRGLRDRFERPKLPGLRGIDVQQPSGFDILQQRRLRQTEVELHRIKDLENLAMNYTGVEKAYAIQAGRELRVIVEADKVSDQESDRLSFEIAQKIQTEMTFPGQIKVTVIREKRAVNVAR